MTARFVSVSTRARNGQQYELSSPDDRWTGPSSSFKGSTVHWTKHINFLLAKNILPAKILIKSVSISNDVVLKFTLVLLTSKRTWNLANCNERYDRQKTANSVLHVNDAAALSKNVGDHFMHANKYESYPSNAEVQQDC